MIMLYLPYLHSAVSSTGTLKQRFCSVQFAVVRLVRCPVSAVQNC